MAVVLRRWSVVTGGDSRLSQLRDPETGPLLYHTARNMRARQLLGVAERKLRHLVVPSLPVDFDARYEPSAPVDVTANPRPLRENVARLRGSLASETRAAYRERLGGLEDGEVTFIRRTVAVTGPDGVVWTGTAVTDPPALWALKFHGFAFLPWAFLGADDPAACPAATATAREWLHDWDRDPETRVGTEAYLRRVWTPHAVSLRVINLARYYAWARLDEPDSRDEEQFAALLRRLVAKNAAFLASHVEHDVGGNHLIENGAALVMAGVFLDVERWGQQGRSVLTEAADQFLADGGQFERSPMYHVLTLTRYLTVLDLLEATDRAVPPAVRRVAAAGTAFLRALEPPDGRLPLLNDSVHGESLSLRACLAYAGRVGVDAPPSGNPERALSSDGGAARIHGDAVAPDCDAPVPDRDAPDRPGGGGLDASGYYWLDTDCGRVLVDGAAIGPPHLPAHSHNDHFAVLLWIGDHRVATDTGTVVYAPTSERSYCRSVAAHNTVQYGDCEPIPVGGSYLFGRRIDATVRTGVGDHGPAFDGWYRRGDGSYAHRRRVFAGENWWLVWDDVAGDAGTDSPPPVRSRLHLDPAVSVTTGGEGRLDFDHDDASGAEPLVSLYPVGDVTPPGSPDDPPAVGTSPHYPQFGVRETRPSVTLRGDGPAAAMGYLLSPRSFESVAVDATDPGLVLSLDGRTRRLYATPQ